MPDLLPSLSADALYFDYSLQGVSPPYLSDTALIASDVLLLVF